MKLKRNSKLIILVIAILLVIGSISYYLFIPAYEKSKDINEIYIYIKDGLSQKKYTVKYNEELSIKVKNKDFSILLPYNHTITADWKLISTNDNTTLTNSFIKECRTPLYDRGKDGADYSMKIFKFRNNKPSTEKLVFKYAHTKDPNSFESLNIVINIQYD